MCAFPPGCKKSAGKRSLVHIEEDAEQVSRRRNSRVVEDHKLYPRICQCRSLGGLGGIISGRDDDVAAFRYEVINVDLILILGKAGTALLVKVKVLCCIIAARPDSLVETRI